MALAIKLGVSPAKLRGREPREFVVYEYEGDRVVGYTTYHEPEFSTDDVTLLLAHLENEADVGPHGFPLSEAMSAEADPKRDGGWRYSSSERPAIDYADKARLDAEDDYRKRYPDANMNGLRFRVRKVVTD